MWLAKTRAHWLSLGLLAGTAGCTISIQPWTKPGHAVPGPGDPVVPAGGPPPGMLPPNALPRTAPPVNMPNEQISQILKTMSEAEEQRRALLERNQTLMQQIKERDDGLRRAVFEIDGAAKQVRRAQEDLRQWHGEMDDLRDRMKRLEVERDSLQPLIDEIKAELGGKKESLKFRNSGSVVGPSLR